ncbi:MAG TPA: stress response translation initiation inhibitor YciH [Elusimicrobia bacterium]|nr:MAG: hypothetical protein A2278_00335 [Elusimicrobia bacterium RIFOXYA12_FULL_49_49]OGS09818.1 MAG: hypothetical protein A2204_04765 [Elusimicrobia bacterium RIFOXYA1_FULL_47_7]OGS15109.1 MAG: hypothetical protein A2251_00345 [Elusimicrobia bacterium RIFOXYA2_FULL_47_53]OGS29729.1 MAG: hypothetical protein A2323_01145 [Elusimicrobia bacterium RIFOXYB2_FULL_46_23]HBU70206.1 stress response translation initiation inhibitor YciH [Elusimicrobiota bacterium]
MTKLTNGQGWAFVPELAPSAKRNQASPKPKIRSEKRSGKIVTVISGLHTYGTDRLNNIAKELKSLCASGGTVKNGVIEIQGDKTAQIREWFNKNL